MGPEIGGRLAGLSHAVAPGANWIMPQGLEYRLRMLVPGLVSVVRICPCTWLMAARDVLIAA